MTIFGFDVTHLFEIWVLGCICTGFADGLVRGFCRAWKENKEEAKKNA